MRSLLLIPLLALSTAALAQEEPAPKVIVAPVTTVDFDTVELDVPLVRPSIVWMSEVERPRFNPLIRLRKSWEPELLGSVGTVR